ncbi:MULTISPECIES: hypothetical protein [Campylobacter]|uniref:hypothetical protein n=1 Tax=Campylobacter TaxID=194 RepID=UPI000B3FAE1D|nr:MULTISPECIES: hypothetical protein [Campylobacter]MCR8677771.1 hypothetical protein [Campylobacter sp. S4:11]MCR8686936.1 hypothetical protein [Campylobacter sp. 1569]EAJ6151319.1 hypothetical protein [Campylobacter lari]MBT0816171.1 hypothetical protein [Campylobacter lari]MCV3552120.1 hypothetical protein [Campylobacter sp. CNRCH_2013_0855]
MILLISLLTLILCFLNYYFLYPIDQKLFFVYTFVSILIFIIACICITLKNQKIKKNKFLTQEIEKYFSLPKSNSLEELKENLKLLFDSINKQLQDQKLQNKLVQKNFQYLIQGLSYLQADNLSTLKPILQQYHHNKISTNNCFENIHVGIINNNVIENFLLQCILLNIGISSEIINDYKERNFTFIISKERVDDILNFTFTEIYTEDIINFLNVNFAQENYRKENSNVLIFKSTSFENNLILNITNQFCPNNQAVNNLSDFKKALQLNFKLILIDYEVIKFDLIHISQILHEYKIKNPKNTILLFSKDRIKNCDFANMVLNDINKIEWLALLKKYINQA